MSIIPPEPCPIHDPERAYWRMKLLQEFGGQTTTTTSTIPKFEPPVPPKPVVHLLATERLCDIITECGVVIGDSSDGAWSRKMEWVDCDECKGGPIYAGNE